MPTYLQTQIGIIAGGGNDGTLDIVVPDLSLTLSGVKTVFPKNFYPGGHTVHVGQVDQNTWEIIAPGIDCDTVIEDWPQYQKSKMKTGFADNNLDAGHVEKFSVDITTYISCPPIYFKENDEEYVAIANHYNNYSGIHCFNAKTGEKMWEHSVDFEMDKNFFGSDSIGPNPNGSICLYGGNIYYLCTVLTEKNTEYQADSDDGFVWYTSEAGATGRHFEIGPQSPYAEFKFVHDNVLYAKSSADSIDIPDLDGRYLIYYSGGVLTYILDPGYPGEFQWPDGVLRVASMTWSTTWGLVDWRDWRDYIDDPMETNIGQHYCFVKLYVIDTSGNFVANYRQTFEQSQFFGSLTPPHDFEPGWKFIDTNGEYGFSRLGIYNEWYSIITSDDNGNFYFTINYSLSSSGVISHLIKADSNGTFTFIRNSNGFSCVDSAREKTGVSTIIGDKIIFINGFDENSETGLGIGAYSASMVPDWTFGSGALDFRGVDPAAYKRGDQETVYACAKNTQKLYAINSNGTEKWNYQLPGAGFDGIALYEAVNSVDGYFPVIIGVTDSGYLYSKADGSTRDTYNWSVDTEQTGLRTPIVDRGRIYVPCNWGLLIYNLKGERVSFHETYSNSYPCCAGEQCIYYGDYSGKLTALGT